MSRAHMNFVNLNCDSTIIYQYLSLWWTRTSVWLLVTALLFLSDWYPCWDLDCLDEWDLWFLTTSGTGTLVREDGFKFCCWFWCNFENVSIERLLLRLAINAFFSACVDGVRLCWSMTTLSGGNNCDWASGNGWYFPVLPSSICKPYRWYDTLLKLLLNKKSLLFPLFVFWTDLLSAGEHPRVLLASLDWKVSSGFGFLNYQKKIYYLYWLIIMK